jgi:hypothetical protein
LRRFCLRVGDSCKDTPHLDAAGVNSDNVTVNLVPIYPVQLSK